MFLKYLYSILFFITIPLVAPKADASWFAKNLFGKGGAPKVELNASSRDIADGLKQGIQEGFEGAAEGIPTKFAEGFTKATGQLNADSKTIGTNLAGAGVGIMESVVDATATAQETARLEAAAAKGTDLATRIATAGVKGARTNINGLVSEGVSLAGDASKSFREGMQASEIGNNVESGIREITDRAFGAVFKPLIKYSGYFALTIAGVGFSYHYGKKWITARAFMPELQMSKAANPITHWYRKNFSKSSIPSYEDLYYTDRTKNELKKYLEVYRLAKSKNRPLPTLLLYGPPGTGKTKFASVLAKNENDSYVFISGSSFSQFEEHKALEIMNNIFRNAMHPGVTSRLGNKIAGKSRRRLMIVVDEAELFLGKRSGKLSEKSQKLLTQWLALTGEKSSEVTIIYLTNRPNILDEAMERRITYQVEIGLPDFEVRMKTYKHYFKNYVQSDDDLKIDEEVNTPEYINALVNKMDGLSQADIEDTCSRIQNEAHLNGRRVSANIIEDARSAIEARHKAKKDYVNSAKKK